MVRGRSRSSERATASAAGEVHAGEGRAVVRVPAQLRVEHGLDQGAQSEAVLGRDEVDRASHQHDPHQPAVLDEIAQPSRVEGVQP